MKNFLLRLYIIISIVMIVVLTFFPRKNVIYTYASGKSLRTTAFSVTSFSIKTDEFSNVIEKEVNKLQTGVSNNLVSASIITDVLETQVGTMSAYGLDCSGCSGVVGARYNAAANNVRYYDEKYGELRIVAGDKKYPYGTIVRVVDSKIGTFNAIILDRGGDIGIGRRYMFDLLFYTEAEAYGFGLSRNTTFEILRYGY